MAYEEYKYNDYIFTKPIESLTELSGTLKDKWLEFKVELVNCAPEEFDAKYEAAKQEYLDLGYQRVLDEKAAVYDEMQSSAAQNG